MRQEIGRPPKELTERLKMYFPVYFTTPAGEQTLKEFTERQEREELMKGTKGRQSFSEGFRVRHYQHVEHDFQN